MRCNCGKYDNTDVIERGNEIHSPHFCGGKHAYMAKINQQAKEIAKLRKALISVESSLGYMFDQEDRDLVKAALQEERP